MKCERFLIALCHRFFVVSYQGQKYSLNFFNIDNIKVCEIIMRLNLLMQYWYMSTNVLSINNTCNCSQKKGLCINRFISILYTFFQTKNFNRKWECICMVVSLKQTLKAETKLNAILVIDYFSYYFWIIKIRFVNPMVICFSLKYQIGHFESSYVLVWVSLIIIGS